MQIVQPQKSGGELFTEAFNPYLQMIAQAMLKKRMDKPAEDRAQAKEEREWISAVSKGEAPATAIPESLRKKLFKGPQVSAEGLTGKTEGLQNLPYGAQISGTPEFMKRVTPQETPEMAQQRLMGTYAQQQQAINPYRALGGQKLEARQKIEDLVNSGVALEKVPIELKIQAGYMTPEAGSGRGININLGGLDLGGGQPQAQEAIPKYDPKKEKLQYNPTTKQYRVVPL